MSLSSIRMQLVFSPYSSQRRVNSRHLYGHLGGSTDRYSWAVEPEVRGIPGPKVSEFAMYGKIGSLPLPIVALSWGEVL